MQAAAKKRRTALTMLLMTCLALAGCSASQQNTVVNPLAGAKLYTGQAIHAITAEHNLQAAGETEKARQIAKIASQPTATWLSGGSGGQYDHVLEANILADAKRDELPVFVLYNLPYRDAGEQHSVGGADSAQAYKEWAGSIAAEMTGRQAIFIVEPDGVAAIASGRLTDKQAAERLDLISYAAQKLASLPNTHVYIDAGNPGWTNPGEMAGLLRKAGVEKTNGIAVNVSNFYSDDDSARYGQKLSELLGGAGVVVDTSRNGNGPLKPSDSLSWCNPPGRAIGRLPSIGGKTDTIQAWLWIKPPGDSDGSCRPGEPPAGQFWVDYALELVKGK